MQDKCDLINVQHTSVKEIVYEMKHRLGWGD